MTIPGQNVNINDPGLGSSEPATMRPIFVGPSSSGDSAIHSVSTPSDAVSIFDDGPLTEWASYVLQNGGGPVLMLKAAASVAASNGAVTKTAKGSSTGTVTVAGTALAAFRVIVQIMGTGTVATGSFRYSLDNGYSWSSTLTIPSVGTYLIARTGLTLTFVPGAGAVYFEAGDSHAFSTTAAAMNSTDLDAAMVTIKASALPWRFLVLCGRQATSSAGATLFAALGTHMTALESLFRYRRAIMDAGIDIEATVATSYAAQTHTRINVAYGTMDAVSAKPFTGWGVAQLPIAVAAARNAVGPRSLGWGIPSTDLKRVRGGSLAGVVANADGSPAISHDEYKTETLDALGFTTSRTYPNDSAPYLTQGRLKAPAGSDYARWHLGILMDIACEIVVSQQSIWVGDDIRTNADGSIDERDAGRIETQIQGQLNAEFRSQPRANGQLGYVQDIVFRINRTANVRSNGYVTTEVQMVPLRTIEGFNTTLGLTQSINVPLAA